MSKIKLNCKLGVLTRPDGSALFAEGETTVIAGIYGPLEAKANKTLIDRATVEAHFRPKTQLPGVKEKVNELLLKNVCEAALGVSCYPRTSVIVVIQELHNEGHLISCALNAACMATLNSGINMKCMFASVTCFLTKPGILDLVCPLNKDDLKATFIIVFESVEKKILASHTEGFYSENEFHEALQLCKEEAEQIFAFFKSSLTK